MNNFRSVSTCHSFQRLWNRLSLVSCTSTWRQTTYFHVSSQRTASTIPQKPQCSASGPTHWWQQMIGRWCWLDCWTFQQLSTASITLCYWNVSSLLRVSLIQSLTGCSHFWPTECSRLLTVVICLLCRRYYLGLHKDPYWARCCMFCTQLSRPSSLTVKDSVCTSMPMTRRSTSAHSPMTLRLLSNVFLRISSTSRHGWRPGNFD